MQTPKKTVWGLCSGVMYFFVRVVLYTIFFRPCSTVHNIYGFFPPLEPGQNPGQKPGQKPSQKSGQQSGQKYGQKSGQKSFNNNKKK